MYLVSIVLGLSWGLGLIREKILTAHPKLSWGLKDRKKLPITEAVPNL